MDIMRLEYNAIYLLNFLRHLQVFTMCNHHNKGNKEERKKRIFKEGNI